MSEAKTAGGRQAVLVYCVHTREERAWREKLAMHLSQLARDGLLELWDERESEPGADWQREQDEELERAGLILLLVSPAFVASPFCASSGLARLLERQRRGQALVVPLLLRPCDWRTAPFGHLRPLPTDERCISQWSEREEDEAWLLVVAGLRHMLSTQPQGFAHRPPSAEQGAWTIPFARNPSFSGREEQLRTLGKQLRSRQRAAIGQIQAISGLGGIGKTQLAIEYAYRHRADYTWIFWARADTIETLNGSYSEIAALLDLREKDAQKQEIVVQGVKSWLHSHADYLLILDNADDPAILPAFVPPDPAGHLLITTRAADLSGLGLGLGEPLALRLLTPQQGVELLLRRAGLLASASPQEQALAVQLADELGGLCLALDQAGAYLSATRTSLASYLSLYRQHHSRLLAERRNSREHPEPVASTWDLSFQRVEQHNPAAADLLRFCAFLAPDAIPEEILTEGARHLGPLLAPVVSDPFQLNAAIASLRAYSLLDRDPHSPLLIVHRLVQIVLRESLPWETQREWMQRAVQTVAAAYPGSDFVHWLALERWLPHAQACTAWIELADLSSIDEARLLNQAGSYLYSRARYEEAEPLYRRALVIREQELGTSHSSTAQSLNNMAMIHQDQGKYDEAESLYRQALEIYERELGASHPHTAASLDNLAGLYRAQEKYGEAEPLLQRALEIREQELGASNRHTATSLNNLAMLYRAQGKYGAAEPLLKRALEIREQKLEASHPDTASSLNNLALLYQDQGKYGEAEPLYRQAVQIREQALGFHHPSTANSLNNLASLYEAQGKYGEAESLLRRALAINEQVLGRAHPSARMVRQNYAALLRNMGRGEEAREVEEGG
ncbi:MAG TPA: FxSxx-COOH system tetratricopeptide repeat protein [Ktedonobacteraceae bacterium]